MLFDEHFMKQMKADLKDYKILDIKKDAEPLFMKLDLYVNKTKKRISMKSFMVGTYNKGIFTWNPNSLKIMKNLYKKYNRVKVYKFFSKMLKKKVKIEDKMHRALVYFFYLFFISAKTSILAIKSPNNEISYVLTELPMRKKFNQADIDLLMTAVSAINEGH